MTRRTTETQPLSELVAGFSELSTRRTYYIYFDARLGGYILKKGGTRHGAILDNMYTLEDAIQAALERAQSDDRSLAYS